VFHGLQDLAAETDHYIQMPNVGKFNKAPTEEIASITLFQVDIDSELSSEIEADEPIAGIETVEDVGAQISLGGTVEEIILYAQEPEPNSQEPEILAQSTLLNVPFTSQAPFANWDNVVYQQGCEEASILMAMLWAEGKKYIGKKDAERAILAISNFEQDHFGEFKDTSVADTAEIMRSYFDYQNIEVKNNITAEDIKAELANGNLVITAINGQKVGNPFYSGLGPLQHMIVIKGYDAERKEFISNDPGTMRGEGYRYAESVLDAALQDYITGFKEPILEVNKRMIVVRPS